MKKIINTVDVEVVDENFQSINFHTKIGEGVTTSLVGITLNLDRKLGFDLKQNLLLEVCGFILRLAGE